MYVPSSLVPGQRDSGAAAQRRLRIAVQRSGRLAEASHLLLHDSGLSFWRGENELSVRVANYPVDLLFVRDDDIPSFVSEGICELGIVGRNVVEEFALTGEGRRIDIVAALGFGRCSLAIAAPDGADYAGPQSLAGARIATSHPRLLQAFLDRQGVSATLLTMSGSVELAPRLDIAAFICDLVATGGTLRANQLHVVATVAESEAVLVRSARSVSPDRRALHDRIVGSIEAAVADRRLPDGAGPTAERALH